jgi:hypothetical protein
MIDERLLPVYETRSDLDVPESVVLAIHSVIEETTP